MIENFKEKLMNTKLTKTELKIANFFLDNEELLYFKAASEIASEIGVSDSSVIRFVKFLGYKSYSDFQEHVQRELKLIMQSFQNDLTPAGKLLSSMNSLDKIDLNTKVFQLTCSNLESTFLKNSAESIEKATEILFHSEKKFLVSIRGSATVAFFLKEKLKLILPNVEPVMNGDHSLILSMADIGPNDCLFVVSFPRYSRIVLSAISMAKKANAKIIVLTDRITSPVAKKADVVLLANSETVGFSNSYVSALFVADLIISNISQKLEQSHMERLKLIEEYTKVNNINLLDDIVPRIVD